jgi:nitrogen regulatory protein PII 2
MKKAIAVIRPQVYKQTKASLEQEGFIAFSAVNVLGRGKKNVALTAADNSTSAVQSDDHRFVAKKMIIVYIRDEDEERFVKAVLNANKTGHAGDGKIFIIPVNQGIRIRSGEKGDDALF